ncbi:MAG: peptidoglycan-binding domain-containing protein [Acetobacteraceae bacterium]
MAFAYRLAGLCRAVGTDHGLVQVLQRDLRALGYLWRGIDGEFGLLTQAAVRALQYDLLHNDGRSTGKDGDAPVAVKSFSQGVRDVTGIVDPALADSIEALLGEDRVPKLPSSRDAATANRDAFAEIFRAAGRRVPMPFLLAMFQQESGCRHYAVPKPPGDADSYVIIGLDRDSKDADHILSRGYGIGQYTISHHPPRPEEVSGFIADPLRNIEQAVDVFVDKFEKWVRGAAGARDYRAEHPALNALRLCRYAPSDPSYMSACRDCAATAGKHDLGPDSPLYKGTRQTYGEVHHHRPTTYRGVPDRADFQCDWPYAMRRYNGCGPDSFNYQAIILGSLLAPPPSGPEG